MMEPIWLDHPENVSLLDFSHLQVCLHLSHPRLARDIHPLPIAAADRLLQKCDRREYQDTLWEEEGGGGGWTGCECFDVGGACTRWHVRLTSVQLQRL